MDDPTISKLRGTNAPILFRPPRKYKKAFGFLFFFQGYQMEILARNGVTKLIHKSLGETFILQQKKKKDIS